jgi:sarcosine oxidase
VTLSRRSVVAALAAVPFTRTLPRSLLLRPHGAAEHVAVVGAGAFGGWTALSLLRAGFRVTLVDAYGAGNSRASSGGETRLTRAVYSGDAEYIEMVVRATALWRDAERAWGRSFLRRTGALWLFEDERDAYARASAPIMARHGLPLDELSSAEAGRRWPQIAFGDLKRIWYEPDAGVLLARASCAAVVDAFVREGGEFRVASVRPGAASGRALHAVALADGTTLAADRVVFACGPWLGRLFPDVIGRRIRATRQEMFFFGTAPGDRRFDDTSVPAWANFADRLYYGMPGNEARGFKAADDTLGDEIDPDALERIVRPDALRRVRAFVARRFPALARAPIVETRVCQYEYSTDGGFVVDRHPAFDNVVLAGGGSGHGFKMGPAIGEHIARVVAGTEPVRPKFALSRLTDPGAAPAARRR